MQLYQVCFLFYIIKCSLEKLLLSNSYGTINHLEIQQDYINLTIWMQIRYPFVKLKNFVPFRIMDQNNQEQLIIYASSDKETMILKYDLQNSIQDNQSFDMKYKLFEWIDLTIERNICFNRLFNNEINMTIKCDKQFNATLFAMISKQIQILIYDKPEFSNQEIVISQMGEKINLIIFNIYKNSLEITFYAKFYCNLYQKGKLFEYSINEQGSFTLSYQFDIMQFQLEHDQDIILQKLTQKIKFDQWVFFFISFENFKITIQFQINNDMDEFVIELDTYMNFTNQQNLYYLFENNLFIFKSQTTSCYKILIRNNIELKKNESLCFSDCLNCVEFVCQDDQKIEQELLTIREDVQYSNQFMRCFSNNFKYDFSESILLYQNCIEYKKSMPKYYGEYCIYCQIQQKQTERNVITDFILDNNYLYNFENFDIAFQDVEPTLIGLVYQQDLNIFICKIKDIFFIYKTEERFYCENGYVYNKLKCVKQSRMCKLQKEECSLCYQKYSLLKQRCIKCQKNCLICKILNKKIFCILFFNDYYQNDFGLIKQCKQDQKDLACQGREQIIQTLTVMGHNICQLMGQSYIYNPYNDDCYHFDTDNYKYLFNYPKQQIYEQKLEIQDMILLQNISLNEQQINLLILYQQINKMSVLANQYYKKSSLIQKKQNFEYLNNIKQTNDNIEEKKFVFQGLLVYLGETLMMKYQNQYFTNMLDLYQAISITFRTVQFNLLLIAYEPNLFKNEFYSIAFDYEQFKNVTFILDITFQIQPQILNNLCVKFFFSAHQVIINNLTFLNSFDQNCGIGLFQIDAYEILVNNLLVQNSILINQIFQIDQFYNLTFSNICIMDSKLRDFIVASAQKENKFSDSIVNLTKIFFCASEIQNFIVILQVSEILINQIYYKDSILKENIIKIAGTQTEHIEINSIMYYNITLNKSNSILIQLSSQSMIIITNVTIQVALLINSNIIFIQDKTLLNISKIFLIRVNLSYSSFTTVSNFHRCQINQMYSTKINIYKESQILNLVGIESVIIDFYFRTIDLNYESIIIFSQMKAINNIFNLNIQNVESNDARLFTFEGYFSSLNRIKIDNLVIEKGDYQILINSLKQISNAIIDKMILSNSTLLKIVSNFGYIYQLQMINFEIINPSLNQLILLEGYTYNFESTIFKLINISSKMMNFCIIKVENSHFLKITKLQLNQILSEQIKSQIIFINSEIFDLIITNSSIINLQFIQFLSTKSQNLHLHGIYFENIEILSPFIYYQCIKQNYHHQINITFLKIFNFIGSFLELITNQNIFVACDMIIISNFQNSGILFQIRSLSEITSRLEISNIQLFNQKINFYKPTSNGSIFQVLSFGNIEVRSIQITDIISQLLQINQTKSIKIGQLFIKKFFSSNFIVEIISPLGAGQFLLFSNIFIINSDKEIGGVFKFLNEYKSHFILNNISLINITTLYPVFQFITKSSLTWINLNRILLKNVSSQQSIISSDISINLQKSFIIGGQSKIIFNVSYSQIQLKQTLIASINQLCVLSESRLTNTQDSEIVDSKIIYNDLTLILEQSIIFLGKFQIQNNQIKIFLSLNNGQSFVRQYLIDSKLYQFQFSMNNITNYSYLHLPSGQNIQTYYYLDYKTFQYNRIYDSVSFVSNYQLEQIQCNLTQEYKNKVISQHQINLVPGVNIINNLVVILNPFLKDKYITLDLICNENNEIITYRTLIKTFNCQLGEFLHKDQCLLCNIDQQLYSVGYNQANCQFIDTDKIQELKIGQIKLYQSYWRFSLSNKYIELCQTENCLGGWKTGDSSCKIGYIGAICSECDNNNIRGDGYYGKIENQCNLCYFDETIYFKALLAIIYQLLIIYINQYTNKQQSEQYLLIRIAQRKFTEILLRQNVNQATITFKLYYNYLFTLYLLKETINFGYYINVSFFDIIYNPNLIAVPQLECLLHSLNQIPVQYSQLFYKILMPLLIFNIFITIYIILITTRISKHKIQLVLICIITIFQQNQYIILQSLIRLSQKVKYSNIFWILEYKASQFYTQIHQQQLVTLIIPLIILFVIINIIMVYWIKLINSRIFNNLKLPLLIYRQYHNKFYYWEFLRVSFIYLFMLTIYNESYSFYVIIIILIFSSINQTYKPFVLNNLNQIDNFILQFSIFSYFVILIVKQINSFHAFLILIVSNIVLVNIIIKYLIHSFNHQYRKTITKFMLELCQIVPRLKLFINIKKTDKLNYHYSVLKFASKKSNNSLSAIFHNTFSKSNPYTPIEIELSNLKIK